jgi:hypothetical protein
MHASRAPGLGHPVAFGNIGRRFGRRFGSCISSAKGFIVSPQFATVLCPCCSHHVALCTMFHR